MTDEPDPHSKLSATAAAAQSTSRAAESSSQAAESASQAAASTMQAASHTQRSAKETAVAAVAVKSSAERATELAADRTVLAFERTYAAWVRTGLFALASGVGARRLLHGIVPNWMAASTSSVLLAFSIFCFGAGVWRLFSRIDRPEPGIPRLPGLILIAVNACLSLAVLAALVGLAMGGDSQ